MKKGSVVADIKQGQAVDGIFIVISKRLNEGKNGPYLALKLMDKTGEIEGRIWENAQDADNAFEQRDFVSIKGDALSWQGITQVRISEIKRLTDKDLVNEDMDMTLFMPVTAEDRHGLWLNLAKFIESIKTPLYQNLLSNLFHDKQIINAFVNAPAAKNLHHAYLGGLLEHCVSVARLADAVSGLYPRLNRDLLMTAAIIHDIGKIDEFTFARPPIDYSSKGRLLGHSMLGLAAINKAAARLNLDEDAHELIALQHLVLSHHGQKEFGAPILPMMEEAIVLHMIDDLDAKLNYLDGLRNGIKGADYGWTEYQRPYGRYFYLRGENNAGDDVDEDAAAQKNEDGKDASAQMSLWPAGNNE